MTVVRIAVTTKRKGGRPQLPPEQRQSEKLQVYVTAEEADETHRSAFRQGLTTSEYLRIKLGFQTLETIDLPN